MNKSQTPRLFKFKQWLTLPETAKHFSNIFSEEVKEIDILRLALDGHLKLSVHFAGNTIAKLGNLVSLDSIEELALHNIIPTYNDKNEFLYLENKVEVINNVWDLTMFGSERNNIEEEWNHLSRIPTEAYQSYKYETKGNELLLGAIVSNDGKFAQLQINKALTLFDNEQTDFINSWESRPEHENFCPSFNLPLNSMLVVRTDALYKFEQTINNNEVGKKTATKPHGNTERFAKNREEILGAALSVITQCPEKCKNDSGKFEATKIAKLVDEKAYKYWPITHEPPLCRAKMEDEIGKWMNKKW